MMKDDSLRRMADEYTLEIDGAFAGLSVRPTDDNWIISVFFHRITLLVHSCERSVNPVYCMTSPFVICSQRTAGVSVITTSFSTLSKIK